MDERAYWLGFSLFSGIGPMRLAKLLDFFGTAKNAWQGSISDLRESGIGEKLVTDFDTFRQANDIIEYQEKLEKKSVYYLTQLDTAYPKLLTKIKNPPLVLFVKGAVDNFFLDKPVAIVGSRKISEYGQQVTSLLTTELVQSGCIIVSGLAFGVDSIAHKTTIDNQGKTIAVLGCGVDCCSPIENEGIYNSILSHGGTILSEYPLGVSPTKGSFPSRNRIIAGLSLGVVVTEGAVDSGSLITASNAFENNRKVFAVPGPITSTLSKGPYDLIKKGAKLVTTGKEILDELNISTTLISKNKKIIKGETAQEQCIIDLLQTQPLHFDEIVRKTKFSSANIGSLLSLLEMKGIVQPLDSGYYSLADKL